MTQELLTSRGQPGSAFNRLEQALGLGLSYSRKALAGQQHPLSHPNDPNSLIIHHPLDPLRLDFCR